MEAQDIRALLEKYKNGSITDAEKAILDKWYLHVSADSDETLTESQRQHAFDTVLQHIEQLSAPKPARSLWPRIAAAAAILVGITAGVWYFTNNETKPTSGQLVQQDIRPGHYGATITAESGNVIQLDSTKRGVIIGQALRYTDGSTAGNINSNNNIQQLTAVTEKGQTYSFTLPDGTLVYLNAGSKLTFPSAFNTANRQVSLEGEGYFEVAKDKTHPFLVTARNQTVRVLGTHFNINSYADEPSTATTLLEGSVEVTAGSDKKVIRPGEQAQNTGNAIQVLTVDTENIIDWKSGDFNLDQVDFRLAMRKIARWYDVEVIYDASVPDNIRSGGWISRSQPLSSVLKAIEKSGLVHFRIEGRKIYVNK